MFELENPLGQLHIVVLSFGVTHAGSVQGVNCMKYSPPKSVQRPLRATKPGEQLGVHTERTHAGVPFAGTPHPVAHDPQWAVLDVRSVSQPFAALPSQSPKPAAQVNEQVPPEQWATPWLGTGHAVHVAPQWLSSVAVSTQDMPHRVSPIAQLFEHENVVPLCEQ
jgi:hypothetical protein